jgi:hypothetical protein
MQSGFARHAVEPQTKKAIFASQLNYRHHLTSVAIVAALSPSPMKLEFVFHILEPGV